MKLPGIYTPGWLWTLMRPIIGDEYSLRLVPGFMPGAILLFGTFG